MQACLRLVMVSALGGAARDAFSASVPWQLHPKPPFSWPSACFANKGAVQACAR